MTDRQAVERPKPSRPPRWVQFGVVGVFLAAGVYAFVDGNGADDETGTERGARSACEQFVEGRLKSPGTAKFSDVTASGMDGTWTVRGAVDSQNALGGVVRNNFACKAVYAGSDTYNNLDLQLSNN